MPGHALDEDDLAVARVDDRARRNRQRLPGVVKRQLAGAVQERLDAGRTAERGQRSQGQIGGRAVPPLVADLTRHSTPAGRAGHASGTVTKSPGFNSRRGSSTSSRTPKVWASRSTCGDRSRTRVRERLARERLRFELGDESGADRGQTGLRDVDPTSNVCESSCFESAGAASPPRPTGGTRPVRCGCRRAGRGTARTASGRRRRPGSGTLSPFVRRTRAMWQTGHLAGQSERTPGHIGHQYSVSSETAESRPEPGWSAGPSGCEPTASRRSGPPRPRQGGGSESGRAIARRRGAEGGGGYG